jgi:hypothetical protein
MLRKGWLVNYFSEEDFQRLDALAHRGLQAVAKLRILNDPNDPNHK